MAGANALKHSLVEQPAGSCMLARLCLAGYFRAPFSMFKVLATSESARKGELATANGTLPTPALLVYTHRGGVLHLTPDLLEKLPDAQAVQIDALQL